MSNNINKDTYVGSSYYSDQASEKEKKDKKKQTEELSNLVTLLNQVKEIIALSESGSDVTQACEELSKQSILPDSDKTDTSKKTESHIPTEVNKTEKNSQTNNVCSSTKPPQPSDYTIPSDCPSTQEMAEALAAMSLIIVELGITAAASTNEQYQNAIYMMMAQMEYSAQVLYNYENTAATVEQQWNDYCAYINSMMKTYNNWYYMSISEMGYWGWGIDKMETDIENWVSENLGFTISLNPKDNSVQAVINDANAQVQAGLNAEMEAASNAVYQEMCYSSNPITRQIGDMIFKNAEFTAESMKQLNMMLQQLMQAMELMTECANADMSEGPSNALVTQIMNIMTQMVGQMEGMIARTSAEQVEFSTDNSKQMQSAAQDALNEATKQLKHIQHLIKKQHQNELISKIVTIAVTVVVCTVAIALGQPEIALIAASMCAMQESGANQKITDAMANSIASSLHKNFGVNEEEARRDGRAIAESIVIVVEAALTMGAGFYLGAAAAAETAATTAAEVSTEAAVVSTETAVDSSLEAASAAADSAVSEAAETSQTASEALMQGMKNIFDTIGAANPFQALPAWVNLGILNAAELTASENLAYDGSIAAQGSGKGTLTSEEEMKMQKEAMQTAMAVNISLAIFMMFVAPYSMKSASESANSNVLTNLLKENPKSLFYGVTAVNTSASIVQTAASADMAYNYKKQADATRKMGRAQAAELQYLGLVEAFNQISVDTMNSEQQLLSNRSKVDSEMLRNMYSYMATYTNVINSAV